MATREEWASDKISKLLNEGTRFSALEEIKEYLTLLPHDEVIGTVNLLQLPLLFDCLNDSKKEQVELACDVLSICMSKLSIEEGGTQRYESLLERALNHPNECVKNMVLNEVSKRLQNERFLSDLVINRTSFLTLIIKSIECADYSVVKKASLVLVEIGAKPDGIQKLVSADVKLVFDETMKVSDVIRLRVYNVFIDIAKASEYALRQLDAIGILEQIIATLDDPDILLRLSVLDLMSQLNSVAHGYEYLESKGVIDKIFKQLVDVGDNEDPILSLSEPSILKFFGNLAFIKPSLIVSKYSAILNRLYSNVESDNWVNVGVSLDTLAHIAETTEGKLALDAKNGDMLKIIRLIREKIATYPTETRVRALAFLENVLQVTDMNNRAEIIANKWYTALGDNAIDWIITYAKNPFAEIRVVALSIINAISTQEWAVNIIKNTPGLVEFLLDRRVEVNKECKEVKYAIIKNLATSSNFDHVTQLRLQEFVREGAFYVQGITEVAVEGNE